MKFSARHFSVVSVLLALIVVLTACGGGSGDDSGQNSEPTTVPASNPPTSAANVVQPTTASDSDTDSADPRPTIARPTGPTPTPRPSEFDADGDGWMTWDELQASIAATIPEFEWPPAYSATTDAIVSRFPDDPSITEGKFQVNYEYLQVGIFHRCAWEKTWLDATQSGDNALAAQALDIMTNVIPNNIAFTEMRSSIVEVAQKAALGDPSLVIQDVEVNCSDVPLISASPTATSASTPG